MKPQDKGLLDGIAIIGMAGRFPGAADIGTFWRNLRAGVESISFFSEQELLEAGADPAGLTTPGFVNAGGVLDDIEMFDAGFFSISPREAETMDPQQRVFLEIAWSALEDAGYDPWNHDGPIGVFAGSRMSTYLPQLQATPEFVNLVGSYQLILGNDKDHLTTQASYRLNLRGPSLNIETACSTSLVAASMACQSLIDHQSDLALAGGVSILLPQKAGYYYREGGISSPDGHCRAFDARARGMVGGNGAGVVVLKRLSNALTDRDHIYAVIRGWAINNDGAAKPSYTAPSSKGQAEVIAAAQAFARVSPESITFVETHGTGTAIGDPIEISALTEAFRSGTMKRSYCAVGSVKTNIGHLDPAAGIASLIKTALALRHREIPPTIHFSTPNPEIDFASSPFFVNPSLLQWQRQGNPLRAGVSAFGIGGTNSHMILEESPEPRRRKRATKRPFQVITLSARSRSALDDSAANLLSKLREEPNIDIADVAFTTHVGRHPFARRQIFVCRDRNDAISALERKDPRQLLRTRDPRGGTVTFLFPGQGSQYVGMGKELYHAEPTFRSDMDGWAKAFAQELDIDLLSIIYPTAESPEQSTQLTQTGFAQPALFAVAASLARLWMKWGIRPRAMLGHSIGEYVAAHLSGALSDADAVALVAARGRLMQSLPRGAMLAVALPEEALAGRIPEKVDLAAANGPNSSVVSGPLDSVNELAVSLAADGVQFTKLHTSHAFHSHMMEPIVTAFADRCRHIRWGQPSIPWISNLTGNWITSTEIQDPLYWAKHLRHTVRCAAGIQRIREGGETIFLECGPGRSLAGILRQNGCAASNILASLPTGQDCQFEYPTVLTTLGQLWTAGISIDWNAFHAGDSCRRVSLPTYPFERQRYWVEQPPKAPKAESMASGTLSAGGGAHQEDPVAFYLPEWNPAALPAAIAAPSRLDAIVLFIDEGGLGARVAQALRTADWTVITVAVGEHFAQTGQHEFILSPDSRPDTNRMVAALGRLGLKISRIAHFWLVSPSLPNSAQPWDALGFWSLVYLVQALSDVGATNLAISVIASELHSVHDKDFVSAEKAMILGPCTVIPQEHPGLICRSIDIGVARFDYDNATELVGHISSELKSTSLDPHLAYRNGQRLVRAFKLSPLDPQSNSPDVHDRGVYLVTGGLGGIGVTLAGYLGRSRRARLILTGRRVFPDHAKWDELLESASSDRPLINAIATLKMIEASGGEVFVTSGDVGDRVQMQGILQQASNRFGRLNGVIHCAGVPGGGLLRLKDPIAAAAVFHPKIRGMQVLEELLPPNLDFVALCSSLASVTGGIGQVDYCAANAFLDAAAHRLRLRGINAMSINWPAWREVGMAIETPVALGLEDMRRGALVTGILPQQGVHAFLRILRSGHPQVIVAPAPGEHTIESNAVSANSVPEGTGHHQRPEELSSKFETPRGDVELSLAEIWESLLGLTPIGRDDNFFELGGHSLLALQVLSRIQNTFQVEIQLRRLFELPTVGELARAIEEALMKEIEQLSDKEVQRLLQ